MFIIILNEKNNIFLIFLLISSRSYADSKMALGLEVFNNKAMCGTCHTLISAGSEGQIGPNLDMIKPQISQIIHVVTNGIGVMPPWEGVLTSEEIDAVAYYVFKSTSD